MIKKQVINEKELFKYLYSKIFNADNFEIYPGLQECFEENSLIIDNILYAFIASLYDLSNSVVRPFLDERSTYMYRKVFGILDKGEIQTLVSVGKEFDMTGVRVGQIIKNNNRILTNYIVREYQTIKNNNHSGTSIEELGLSNSLYLRLKRQGITHMEEIDIVSLSNINGFGDRRCAEIKESIAKVREK